MDMTPSSDLPIPRCFSHLIVVNVGDGECPQRLGLNIDNFNHLIDSHLDLALELDLTKVRSESCSFSNDCVCGSNYNTGSKSPNVPYSSPKIKEDQSIDLDLTRSTQTQSSMTLEDCESISYSHPEQFKFDNQSSISETESTVTICNKKSTSDSSNAFYFEENSTQAKEDGTAEYKNPFLKLNSSLMKLQKDMKDLRFLDISLFCQLMSLQESIQDLKLTMSDRFSDTGSEFSLGTASYMGSLSSLTEESDWEESGTSDVFDQSKDLDFDSSFNETQARSASDLLKQITDLALKVEEDF
ncbi:protein FAM89A [Biomphalaria pfeifferi]|uniref:Protein FAM89A n=1 Tax=Biomphalaria pfeifferi TaxID=112525 RepID=A0AAD8BHV0_BIOPF|nr:protein FAM89A [Biomphalaria pfeifferi]